MPLTEDPQWRTVHNMIRLELHQLAFADFSWQGRNTHFFNRLFLVLAGLVFLSALARALYLPGTSDGRTLCAGGLAAFALCLCWELPTVLQTLVQEGGGALLTPTLLFRLGLCGVGALGALSAVRCTRTEQDA